MPRLRSTVTGAAMTVSDKVAARLGSGWVDADVIQRSSEPDSTWKVAELRSFAEENGVDLGEAKKKDEVLAVIVDATNTSGESDSDD